MSDIERAHPASGVRAIRVLAALACALGAVPARAAPPAATAQRSPLRWSVSTGFDFSSGDYGESQTTEVWYVPFQVRAEWRHWLFRVTVPYIHVTGPGSSVTSADGVIVLDEGAGDRESHAGLGDVIAGVTYRFDPPRSGFPWLDVTARVKIPTARESESLGTGEVDATLQIDATHSFGRLTPFASIAYRFVGDPEGSDLSNTLATTLGCDWRFTRAVSAGLYYGWRQTASRSLGDAHDLVPYASWRIGRHWSVGPYFAVGLSTAAPDFGGGVQLGYRH
jgi:hypothetical protein